jgi:hypothetical protein
MPLLVLPPLIHSSIKAGTAPAAAAKRLPPAAVAPIWCSTVHCTHFHSSAKAATAPAAAARMLPPAATAAAAGAPANQLALTHRLGYLYHPCCPKHQHHPKCCCGPLLLQRLAVCLALCALHVASQQRESSHSASSSCYDAAASSSSTAPFPLPLLAYRGICQPS